MTKTVVLIQVRRTEDELDLLGKTEDLRVMIPSYSRDARERKLKIVGIHKTVDS